MRILIAVFVSGIVLFAQTAERKTYFAPPTNNQRATDQRPARDIARAFLESSAGVTPEDLDGVYMAQEYTSSNNGVTHVVYRQRFQGIDVYNAAWVANISPDGEVLSAGGTLYPAPGTIDYAGQITVAGAVRAAVRAVNPSLAATFEPTKSAALPTRALGRTVRFAKGALGADIEGQLAWFGHRGTLLLVWILNVVDADGVSSFDVAVEASSGAVVDKMTMTFFESPKGQVFQKGTPQPNPTPGVRLNSGPPIVDRTLVTLTGDPLPSPMGWVLNNETAGYNAVVGENPLGLTFITNATRTAAPNGDFSFPLSVGPSAPSPLAFRDAANVNLFYWVNRAHDLHYQYGFDEAAGNFQSNNFGRGGVDGDALLAYSHYGAAAPVGASLNNAFFTTKALGDGAQSMIAMYVTVSGPAGYYADGALAADVIVHEYTHGVSIRLLPNGYGAFQTAAMGEAWSDFFALEYLTPMGAPPDGSYPVGEYWSQTWGTGIRTRPFSTNSDINPLTFADLGRVIPYPEVHADGEIWVEALWEARSSLIQQFGEAEGRRRIRQLVMDGLKLSVPSPTMVDARDAILLADRVDFKGGSQSQLWSAFAKRGLGALAYSDGGDSVHILSSSDLPSPTGRLRFFDDPYVPGEPIRLILADSNLSQPTALVQLTSSSGDLEDLILERTGSVYFGTIPSTGAVVARQNGVLNISPADAVSAFYSDFDTGSGQFQQIQVTVSSRQPYAIFSSTSTGFPAFPNEIRLTTVRAPVRLSLGFDFPFFSNKYRSLTVLPTGAIELEPSVFTNLSRPGCNDVFELRRMAAIAPLFANLNFGTAQPNEGIYESILSPKAVAIRWAAETLTSVALSPEPVNFSVTLTDEGVITFYYGTGNQNLNLAIQNASTCGAQPTIGISNGHDVYAASVTARVNNNAPNLIFYPPFNASSVPEVMLEHPSLNETVRGVMTVSGIAYDSGSANNTFISRRDIFIDNVQRGLAASVLRSDFCAKNQVAGCPFVGFQAQLDVAAMGLSAGSHTIFVRVTNTRGGFTDTTPVTFNVDASPGRVPKGAIEVPSGGSELSGTVTVRGYAYADDFRVTRIDLLIDGITFPGTTGGASYNVARPDICGPLSPAPPNCPNVGWTLTLNTKTGTPPLPDGPHSLQLRVLDETGRYSLVGDPVQVTVKNSAVTFPTGALTSVKPGDKLSGTVTVSGYAFSTAGRVLLVSVMVDGSSYATANYGLPRPDDCATLPGVTACPNIGFSGNLDTRLLPNGDHVLGVLIINDAGLTTIVPNLVSEGMNVVIENK
jgi:hypothetical protein